MPRKHTTKGGKKKTISLFEFNQNVGVGADPQLAALPSAPKAASDWEAEGGRPEYNSRGYKERSATGAFGARSRFDSNRNGEGEDHDWARRGPLEESNTGGFGMGGGERDWSDVRRGPIDASNDEAPERDWGDIRRGPVDASFESSRTGEVDWTARRGPVEAERPMARVMNDNAWSSARGGKAVEASFRDTSSTAEPNWSVRRPVDADSSTVVEDKDWAAPRRGPIESEFQKPQSNWERKGPIEAEPVAKATTDADWSAPRKGPVEAEVPQKDEKKEVDWSARKGPIESEAEKNTNSQKEVNFNDMRRGARINELQRLSNNADKVNDRSSERAASMENNWRRERPVSMDGPSRSDHRQYKRPISAGHNEPKEQDWGAARQNQPLPSAPIHRLRDETEHNETIEQEEGTPEQKSTEGADDWTTVRNANRKPTGSTRRGGDNRNFGRRGGYRQGSGNKKEFTRPRGQIINRKTTSSPVTPPVTSTES